MKTTKYISFALLGLVVLALIAGTVLEKMYGTAFATTNVYGSWWFIGLWAVLALSGMYYMYQRRLFRRPATMLLHLSFVLILAGALVTHLTGMQGSIHLRQGEVSNVYVDRETQMVEMLPFALELKEFHLHTYPGTQSAMDYESVVKVVEGGNYGSDGSDENYGSYGSYGRTGNNENSENSENSSAAPLLTISMNNIGTYRHYRFYQSGYDPDHLGTYLSISYDPWGIGLTYTGYGLLLLAMILLMVLPGEGFRRQLRSKAVRTGTAAVLLFMLCVPMQGATKPKVLPADVAAEFGQLYAYYNGRVCPLQTVAIDFTTKLHGKASYDGMTAEQVFTGWMLFPTTWLDQPFIKLKGDGVRQMLGVEGRYASYDNFFDHGTYRLDNALADIHSGVETEDARAISEADEKMNILLMLFNSQLLKIYPVRQHTLSWYSQGDNLPVELPHDEWFFIKHSMDYIGELAAKGDYSELKATLAKIRKYQQRTAGTSSLPTDFRFGAERMYNTTNYTKPLAMLLLTVGIVLFVVGIMLSARRRKLPRWAGIGLATLCSICLLYLIYFISLRAIVAGHVPLANGYETMVFMSACSLVLTLCLWRRHELMPAFGFIMSGVTLLVSMMGQSNPQITPLMPVLASPLLSIHVCVIMMAYTLFAFITLISIARLVRPAWPAPELDRLSILMLYPALFLLTAGIFIGAVWANVSWGRYWGWDPKEVWALITMTVYALPLHRESMAWFRQPHHYHLYMLLAFLSVIITYFGVNFFLGGMHSYANS